MLASVSSFGRVQGDEFFFVPHAAIGHLLLWDLPDARTDIVAYRLARDRQLADVRAGRLRTPLPADNWDTGRQCPVGQTAAGDGQLQYHFWLLAYPDPAGQGVVPCLYQPGEEGGAFLMPLNVRSLTWLSEAVSVEADKHAPFLDRLQALLSDVGEDGMCTFERQLRRTAKWLEFNPVLARHAAAEASREKLFRTLVERQRNPEAKGPA